MERTLKDVGSALRCLVAEKGLRWAKTIPIIQYALDTSTNQITGLSAFYLMYARMPHLSKTTVHPSEDELLSHDEYIKKSAMKMKRAFEIVKTQMDKHLQYREIFIKTTSIIKLGIKYWYFCQLKGKELRLN